MICLPDAMPAMFRESPIPTGPIGEFAANLIAILLLETVDEQQTTEGQANAD